MDTWAASTFQWLWILTSCFASQGSWNTFSCFRKFYIFSFTDCLFRSLPYFLFWCLIFPPGPTSTLWPLAIEFLWFDVMQRFHPAGYYTLFHILTFLVFIWSDFIFFHSLPVDVWVFLNKASPIPWLQKYSPVSYCVRLRKEHSACCGPHSPHLVTFLFIKAPRSHSFQDQLGPDLSAVGKHMSN